MTRTNAYGIFVVLLRAAALWLFCSSVMGLPVLLMQVKEFGGWWSSLGILVPLLVAMLTWVFADKLGRLVMVRPDQPLFESDLPVAEWQALAFSVVGLWQAVVGLIDAAFHGVRWWMARRAFAEIGMDNWQQDFVANWVASVLQLALGIGLMLGARGIVSVLRKWRYAAPAPVGD